MKSKLKLFYEQEGQAYTLEAAITVIFISSVVIFIAPSIATPTPTDTIETAENKGEVKNDLVQLANSHQKDGQLKSLTTNFLTNSWRLSKPGDGEYEVQPVNDKYEQSYARIPGSDSDVDGYYIRPPGPIGANIEQIQDEHDVWIAFYLIPANTNNPTKAEEITFVESNTNDNIIATHSTDVALFGEERFRANPDAKSVSGSAQSAVSGEGIEIKRNDDDSDHHYYIEPSDTSGADDETVYNTVEIKMVAYENPAIGGEQ